MPTNMLRKVGFLAAAGAVAFAVVFGIGPRPEQVAAAAPARAVESPGDDIGTSRRNAIVQAIDKAAPAVVTINVVGDAIVESNEQFTVKLSNASGATLGVATANGTILNDDAAAIKAVISRRSAMVEDTGEFSLADLAMSSTTWQDAASRAHYGLPSAAVSVETRGGSLSPRACDALLSDYTMLPASAIDLADLDSLAAACSSRTRCRANDSALVDFESDAFAANPFACESELAMK